MTIILILILSVFVVIFSQFYDILLDIETDILEQLNSDYDNNDTECEYMACKSEFEYYYCDLNKTNDCNIAYLIPTFGGVGDSTIMLDNYMNGNSALRKVKVDFDKYFDVDMMEFILIGDINFVRIYPGRHPYDCTSQYEILHREWYIRSLIEQPTNNIISSEIANKNCIEWINNTVTDQTNGKYTLYYNIKKNKQCNINDLRESYGVYIFHGADPEYMYKSSYIQYWSNKQWGFIYNKHVVVDGNYYGTIAIGSVLNDIIIPTNYTYLPDNANITISNDTALINDNFTYYYNICNICNQSQCCNESKIPPITPDPITPDPITPDPEEPIIPPTPQTPTIPIFNETNIDSVILVPIILLPSLCFIILFCYYIYISTFVICTQLSVWPPIVMIGMYISDKYISKYNEKKRKKEIADRFEMMCYINE